MNHVRTHNQHILTNEQTVQTLVALAEIDPRDTCLEIGPGTGQITKQLVREAKRVVAIEKDQGFREYLGALKQRTPNLEVIWGNALRCRIPKFDRLVANIPFNISEPLLQRLFKTPFRYAALIVGEKLGDELTQAMQDEPQTRLALLNTCYFQVESLYTIPSSHFDPEPSTDASIIGLRPIKKRAVIRCERYLARSIWDQKSRLVEQSLRNGIETFAVQRFGDQGYVQMRNLMLGLALGPDLLTKRGSALSSQEFVAIYNAIRDSKLAKQIAKQMRRNRLKDIPAHEYTRN